MKPRTIKFSRKKIGGFFELELPLNNNPWHSTTYCLNTGRACFHAIIKSVNPRKIYVPFYACDATFEPLKKCKINYEFYEIDDQFNPKTIPNLQKNDYFLYINYFGLKRDEISRLAIDLKNHLIVDNTQAFYEKGYSESWAFNSARKFFGVPDGAYLFSPQKLELIPEENLSNHFQHLIERLVGNYDKAYQEFLNNELRLDSSIKAPSVLSQRLLSTINYQFTKDRRNQNFIYVHDRLKERNRINVNIEAIDGPLCYPFLISKKLDKRKFHAEGYFIPTYWQDVLNRSVSGFDLERKISSFLLPLPIDQRYTEEDISPLIDFIIGKL